MGEKDYSDDESMATQTLNEIYFPIAVSLGYIAADAPVDDMEKLDWWQWSELEDEERRLEEEELRMEEEEEEEEYVSNNPFALLDD